MSHFLSVYLDVATIMLLLMTGLWVISLLLQRSSIIDIFWGTLFIIIAVVAFLSANGYQLPLEVHLREVLFLTLVTVWGMRLSIYLYIRSRQEGEDHRYVSMRRHWGEKWWWRSYLQVFLLQGGLALVVGAPLVVFFTHDNAHLWHWTDLFAVALWLFGFLFEAVGDYQLTAFKAKAENKGKVCRVGLWALTRHPNYFGDVCVWWGFYAFIIGSGVIESGWGAVSVVGPIVMTYLLLRVSGVSLLERSLTRNYADYQEYKSQTPAFLPRWRKG